MKLKGRDEYSGGSLGIEVTESDAFVWLTVEGMEKNNTVLITPDQAYALGRHLVGRAESVSARVRGEGEQEWQTRPQTG